MVKMRFEARLERKNATILILAILVVPTLTINLFFFIWYSSTVIDASSQHNEVVVGYGNNPVALDPVDTWDTSSRSFQRQVTQSLVEYDLSTHPNYQLKPVLSEYWVWENTTRISFKLRENVYFHDGTRMTAEDVKWNFERVKFFCNTSGILQENATTWEAFSSSLFFLANGTYIFKSFEADDNIDPLNFTINLNSPFSALLDLLTFGVTNILSPDSTPRYKFLDLSKDDLIGTGPYKYVHFKRDREVRLVRNAMYWGFPGFFEFVQFKIDKDDIITNAYNGVYDYFSWDPKQVCYKCGPPPFEIVDVGEDPCYFFLEIYCGPEVYSNGSLKPEQTYQSQKNNATLRRAIALAINHSYIYEEIQSGFAVEGPPAVPRAMPGHNASVVQASDYDHATGIEMARDLMKIYNSTAAAWDSTFGGDNEANWTGTNLIGRNLEINRHFGSRTNLRLNELLNANLKLIGVNTSETIREWGDYLDAGKNTPWEMDICYIGLCPDYLNPYNIIDPLFNLHSEYCYSRINDTTLGGLTDMMNDAIKETNRTKQLEIYRNIQSYIFDVNRPLTPASHIHISGWVYKVQQAHLPDLKGVNYNVMKIIECWDWYKESED